MMGPGQQVAGLDSATKLALGLSIEQDNSVYLSEYKQREDEAEIDYLVNGGRFFKKIEPIDVLPATVQ